MYRQTLRADACTCEWDENVQVETIFTLFLNERQQASKMLETAAACRAGDGLVEVGQALWTDRTMLESHANAVPLLDRRRRRHEAQLSAERRRVLHTEVDLYRRQVELWTRNEHRPQLPLRRLDDPRTHPRRRQFTRDQRRPRETDNEHYQCS